MRKGISFLILLFLCSLCASAQEVLRPRTDVTAFDNVGEMMRGNYQESPYYMSLDEGWDVVEKDSSVRYIRQLEVEGSWSDYHVYINVRGAYSISVKVNGKEVGVADDSRHWNEFLLDDYLQYKKVNTITIDALKYGNGLLLENQDTRVGLHGMPYLLFKSDPNVSDYNLQADYDANTHQGVVNLSAEVFCGKKKGKYYLEAEILDPSGKNVGRMGKWVVFNGRSENTVEMSYTCPSVNPWNAESPTLYYLTIRLRDEKMNEEELIGTHFGFRRIEIKNGQLLLNGKAITLKGVIYGQEYDTETDGHERMLKDIIAMKGNNVNAVRTAINSPIDPYFYNLCDRYGLYVIADANLHPVSNQNQAVATNSEYIPLFERRVDNLYGKYKNQTSIIAWCLGSTTDNGICMSSAYKRLKAQETYRPVIFPAADFGDATDVIAPILHDPNALKQYVAKSGERPCMVMKAVHGDQFSNLETIWPFVESHSVQGVFVAEWPIDAVALADLKQLFGPFDVKMTKLLPDEGEFVVYNRNDFTGFGNSIIEYNIFTNMKPFITGGDLPVAVPVGGSDKAIVRIPAVELQQGEELFVRFDMRTPSTMLNQGSAHIGSVSFPLKTKSGRGETKRITTAPDSSLFTLPVDLSFVGYDSVRCEVVGELVRKPDDNTLCKDRMLRYVTADNDLLCDVRCTQTVYGANDVVFDYSIAPAAGRTRHDALRPYLLVRQRADSVEWFGMDREVCIKGHNSGIVGIYADRFSPMLRQDVRWCALLGGDESTLIEVLHEHVAMKIEADHLELYPLSDTSFRLHIGKCQRANLATQAGYEYPRLTVGTLAPPVISSSAIRFSQPLEVTITSSQPCEIRYTLDGSEPTPQSPLYANPISIGTTTTVKARAFAKDMPPSFTSTRRFNYDYIVKTTFSRRPNTPYNVGTDTLLFDGIRGTADDFSRGWVGFAGGEVATTIQLARPIDVESIVIRYAHAPETWAFAPQKVAVVLSQDGEHYTDTVRAEVGFDPSSSDESGSRVVELHIAIDRPQVGYMKILPSTLATIPAWHRGKGLKPWLLMDELEVHEKANR